MRARTTWLSWLLAMPLAAQAAAQANGQLLVVDRSAGQVALVDPASGKTRSIVEVAPGPVAIAVSPDGRTAAVASRWESNGSLTVFAVSGAKATRTIPLEKRRGTRRFVGVIRCGRAQDAAFLPDGHRVVVLADQRGKLLVIDLGEWSVSGRLKAGASPRSLAWSAPREH